MAETYKKKLILSILINSLKLEALFLDIFDKVLIISIPLTLSYLIDRIRPQQCDLTDAFAASIGRFSGQPLHMSLLDHN
jgi:hypothetical protein